MKHKIILMLLLFASVVNAQIATKIDSGKITARVTDKLRAQASSKPENAYLNYRTGTTNTWARQPMTMQDNGEYDCSLPRVGSKSVEWFVSVGAMSSQTNVARIKTASRRVHLVDSTWFGQDITKQSFIDNVLPVMTNTPPPRKEVSVWAYPGEWGLKITDAGSYTPTSNEVKPVDDLYSLLSPSSGTWRSYKVSAVLENHIGEYTVENTNVSFRVIDTSSCVQSFTNNIVKSSGRPGVATVIGVDTNGISHSVSFVMSEIKPGAVLKRYAFEGDGTTRYIWAKALYDKLAPIDLSSCVAHLDCRSWNNLFKEHSKVSEDTRQIAAALSRFGVNGTVTSEGWNMQTSSGQTAGSPTTPKCVNTGFFWPALHDNLRCFSTSCHESARNWTMWNIPYMVVSPHYVLTAYHYGWDSRAGKPTFQTSTWGNTFTQVTVTEMVNLGMVLHDNGGSTDIRLIRVEPGLPQEICAKFATYETLERLSKSNFDYSIGLTLTSHQTVHPVCAHTTYTSYSWEREPNESSRVETYLDKQIQTMTTDLLARHEHPCHMYESGSPVFLVNPDGKVVPLFGFHWASNGSGSGAPPYMGSLSVLDNMIRGDSGNTEHLQFWSFEDLYTGGTNEIEVIEQ